MDQVRQLAPGVMIIGRYVPTVYDPMVIGPDLLRISKSTGLENTNKGYWIFAAWGDYDTGSELRSPESHAIVKKKAADP